MTPLFIAAHEGHLEVAPCLGSFSSQETERWRLADKQIFANQSILFDMDNLRGNCKGKSIALSMFFQNHRWMYGLSTCYPPCSCRRLHVLEVCWMPCANEAYLSETFVKESRCEHGEYSKETSGQ